VFVSVRLFTNEGVSVAYIYEPVTVVMSTRVEPELREALEQLARLEDRSRAGAIRHAIRHYVNSTSQSQTISQTVERSDARLARA